MAVGITSEPVEALEGSRPSSRGERFRTHGRAARRQVVVGIRRGGHWIGHLGRMTPDEPWRLVPLPVR